MTTRLYCKNHHIVVGEPESSAKNHVTAQFNGRDVSVPQGVASAGGILMLREDTVVCGKTSHEMEVLASDVPDLKPGDRVVIFIGGDDGGVSANGISAFTKIDGRERAVVHEKFVWARIKDGEILPRGKIILTERDDAAFRHHVMGAGTLLHVPGFLEERGASATGAEDGTDAGAMYSVTSLYERVYRVGPAVVGLDRGESVCFSPSYSSARLKRGKAQYHLVDSDEIFFAFSNG